MSAERMADRGDPAAVEPPCNLRHRRLDIVQPIEYRPHVLQPREPEQCALRPVRVAAERV